jgi:predicted ATPase
LLFTDIEGSTRLLHALGNRYADVLAEHRRAIRDTVARRGGVEVDTQGDALLVAFARARDAVAAAEHVQRALAESPVRVRIGIHTGEPRLTHEGYVGVDVHRGARIAAAGHGGQVLLSQTTRDLLEGEVELRDLGEHRLKDMGAPQRLYQLGAQVFPPLKTLHHVNLPVQATPMVGRRRELTEATELVRRHRLVTLVGPGGSGKTRLAVQLAADAVEEFEHGVWWVSLATLTDPDLVEPTIAQAVGAKDALADHFRSQRALLLLDNFEHLLAAAPRVATLLRDSPEIKVLATSRAPLHLAAEQEYSVPPLAEVDAMALFTERARAVKASFEPDEHVRAICRRLDGLPLALELAAARVRVLPAAKLAERLERALPLLTGGTRDVPERQRTLRATIEWSHDLLSEDEKQLFARLAVFAGSFSLEAAEDVCNATLDLLQSLVEKNLVPETAAGRFVLLETIREFALERLNDRVELDVTRRRHAEFYLGLVEDVESRLNHANVLAALGEDDANLRAALSYGRDRAPELMLRLVGSLWRFWFYRGRHDEGRRWLEQALGNDRGGTSLARAHALRGLAAVLTSPDDEGRARSLLEEAIAIHRQHEDDAGVARCLNNLGVLLMEADVKPDLDGARKALEESLTLTKRLAERGVHVPLAFPLGNLAELALRRGELDDARRLTEEEFEIAQAEGDDVNIADARGKLAWLAALEEDYEDAARLLRLDLQFSVEIGSRWPGHALALAAVVGAHRGKRRDAARLLGALEAHRDRLGMKWPSDSPVGRKITQTKHKLDEEGFTSARDQGREVSIEEILELGLTLTDTATSAAN